MAIKRQPKNKPSQSRDNVLTKARYEELLKDWQENPFGLSYETLSSSVGTLTDRILSGEIVVDFS